MKIKKSTYAHAWSSVGYVCDELRKRDPEAARLGLAELVALAVRDNFMPAFTELYAGRMSVDRFYRDVYQVSDVARRRSQEQREAKNAKRPRKPRDAPGIVGDDAAGGSAPPAASQPQDLIAEAVVKFAQAASLTDGAAGADGDGAQTLGRQLLTVLDSHPRLEAEIRRVCRLVLKHLDGRGKSSRRGPARGAQPAPPGRGRQLSFDLQAPAEQADGRETERPRDGESRAA